MTPEEWAKKLHIQTFDTWPPGYGVLNGAEVIREAVCEAFEEAAKVVETLSEHYCDDCGWGNEYQHISLVIAEQIREKAKGL